MHVCIRAECAKASAVHIVSVCMYIGDLRLNYLKKQYTVSATTHQMALLLAFNSSEQHSFRYIHTYVRCTRYCRLSVSPYTLYSALLLIDTVYCK